MTNKKLVPDDFNVPEGLGTDGFRLRMLKVKDVEKDYEAVISSIDHLKGFFGPNSKWPSKDLTQEQDRKDLEWHEEEFKKRSSFAFTVLNSDESRCLGCVYIFPSRKKDFEADVFLWVRTSERDTGLDAVLYNTVKKWIRDVWPFQKVAFPGREISWKEWDNLQVRKKARE